VFLLAFSPYTSFLGPNNIISLLCPPTERNSGGVRAHGQKKTNHRYPVSEADRTECARTKAGMRARNRVDDRFLNEKDLEPGPGGELSGMMGAHMHLGAVERICTGVKGLMYL
jgi:hypothetical protein